MTGEHESKLEHDIGMLLLEIKELKEEVSQLKSANRCAKCGGHGVVRSFAGYRDCPACNGKGR